MAKGGGSSRPRFRLLPTVLLTAAILAVPTVVYAWGRNSASFAIHTVTVSGDHLLRGKRALRLLQHDYLGHNLFTVTTGDVMKTLSAVPFVRTASVNRDFPQTLRVTVMEYRPTAYVLSHGVWYLVATDGHVIAPLTKTAAGGPPAASSPSPSATATATSNVAPASGSPAAGTDGFPAPTGRAAALRARLEAGPPSPAFALPRLSTDTTLRSGGTVQDPRVAAALPVITGLPTDLRAGLLVVEVSQVRRLTLLFAHGPTVTWGDARRSQAKTLALQAVLARYAQKRTSCVFVDVSTPDLVLALPVLK